MNIIHYKIPKINYLVNSITFFSILQSSFLLPLYGGTSLLQSLLFWPGTLLEFHHITSLSIKSCADDVTGCSFVC